MEEEEGAAVWNAEFGEAQSTAGGEGQGLVVLRLEEGAGVAAGDELVD